MATSTKVKVLSAVGYIPVFGWFFPLYLAEESRGALFHAKQAMFMSFYLIGSFAIYRVLVFVSGPFFAGILHLLIIANTATVFYFIVRCEYALLAKSRRYEVPFIRHMVDRLTL